MSILFYKADGSINNQSLLNNKLKKIENMSSLRFSSNSIQNVILKIDNIEQRTDLKSIIPSDVRFCQIEMVGGGGGGAYTKLNLSDQQNTFGGGGGGGAGGYVKFNLDMRNVTSMSCLIGKGGSISSTYNNSEDIWKFNVETNKTERAIKTDMNGGSTDIKINDITITANGGSYGTRGNYGYDNNTYSGMISGYGGLGGTYEIKNIINNTIITDPPLCIYGANGENGKYAVPYEASPSSGNGGSSYFGGRNLDSTINYGAGGSNGGIGYQGVIIISYSINVKN
jgi:hypothetical protein